MNVEFVFDVPKEVSNNISIVIEIPSGFNKTPTRSVGNIVDSINLDLFINWTISNLQSSPSKFVISSDLEFPEPVKVVVNGIKRNLIN